MSAWSATIWGKFGVAARVARCRASTGSGPGHDTKRWDSPPSRYSSMVTRSTARSPVRSAVATSDAAQTGTAVCAGGGARTASSTTRPASRSRTCTVARSLPSITANTRRLLRWSTIAISSASVWGCAESPAIHIPRWMCSVRVASCAAALASVPDRPPIKHRPQPELVGLLCFCDELVAGFVS